MRLQLHKLYTEPKLFEPVLFCPGINLILGERSDETRRQGRKVNGVGKSMCVEFLHFALLRSFGQTRLSRIPEDLLPEDLTVVLDLSINGQAMEIRRALDRSDQPTLVRNGQVLTFGNLDEATRYLGDLLFVDLDPVSRGPVSFRSLMSLLMRDEASGFSDVLKTMSASKSVPGDRLPHLYLLGLDVKQYKRFLQIAKEIESQSRIIAKFRDELTRQGQLGIKDIAAELNREKREVEKIEQGLAELRAEPAFAQAEKTLNEIETRLGDLRAKRKAVGFQLEQIRALPQLEIIDDTDIAIVYSRVRGALGEIVGKSLEQAKAFKAEIEAFQRSLLNDEYDRLEREHRGLTDKIRLLSTEHSALVARVDRKGVLKELSAGLHLAVHKQQDYHRRAALLEQYRDAEQKKEDLKSDRHQVLDALRRDLRDHEDVERCLNDEVANIHERIMGISNASFAIHLNSAANAKQPIDFDLRIPDDGSLSVNRTRVFIYDCALMLAPCTRERHPRFLLHDNIFDVDQDTLVQCLNFLQEKVDAGEEFQYILTLNREKIEFEERSKLLRLKVDNVSRARFTKAKPFLGRRYQERNRRNRDQHTE